MSYIIMTYQYVICQTNTSYDIPICHMSYQYIICHTNLSFVNMQKLLQQNITFFKAKCFVIFVCNTIQMMPIFCLKNQLRTIFWVTNWLQPTLQSRYLKYNIKTLDVNFWPAQWYHFLCECLWINYVHIKCWLFFFVCYKTHFVEYFTHSVIIIIVIKYHDTN